MKLFRRILYSMVVVLSVNLHTIFTFLAAELHIPLPWAIKMLVAVVCAVAVIVIVVVPQGLLKLPARIRALSNGCELLCIFMISAFATAVLQGFAAYFAFQHMLPWNTADSPGQLVFFIVGLVFAILGEALVFWGGMLRVYFTSVQLGIKYRVLGAVFAWVPLLNLYYLLKLVRIGWAEVEYETEKYTINGIRAQSRQCETQYPLLMVHGVFFRDFRYLNYWGRIPAELIRNGATVYYGQQQSAASVEDSGRELAVRIREIVEETGCGKLNIIAHSKGGLDCRAALSHQGMAEYVASLTTINTPHHGCVFAENLLKKAPPGLCQFVARSYNKALKQFGEQSTDFLAALQDLTAAACAERNQNTPDMPGVLYQSVTSYCVKARSGKFPLNVSHMLVKRYDGQNDGLVSVDSAKWGQAVTSLSPRGKRGISHGDVIDLNRENIPGFDVREFYVSLVADLKKRGY